MLYVRPLVDRARPVGAQDFAALQVFQVRHHFEDGKPVVERGQVSVPQPFGDLVRGGCAALNERGDAGATLGVVLMRLLYPIAMAGEGRAVRWQDQIQVKGGNAIERGKKLAQGVAAGLPSDIRRYVLQDVIARN